jgi:hypothetical protein
MPPAIINNMEAAMDNIKERFVVITQNLQIMDILFLVLFVGLLALIALAKLRNHRFRLEVIEKQLNITATDKY